MKHFKNRDVPMVVINNECNLIIHKLCIQFIFKISEFYYKINKLFFSFKNLYNF